MCAYHFMWADDIPYGERSSLASAIVSGAIIVRAYSMRCMCAVLVVGVERL